MITRTIEKHAGYSDEQLEIIVANTLIKKGTDELDAYHCCGCGIIFDDKEYTHPLIDVLLLTGKYHLTKPFNDYRITSGFCNPCFEKITRN